MQVKVLIDAIEEVLSSGKSMEQILIDHETGRGNMVIRPGEVDWLPLPDWDPMTIVSYSGTVVRLIAIRARKPGNGAFRRLCEALASKGYTPHVVAPLREMQEKLKKWDWKRRIKGDSQTVEREEYWSPRFAKARGEQQP